jgi:hypothetical protein
MLAWYQLTTHDSVGFFPIKNPLLCFSVVAMCKGTDWGDWIYFLTIFLQKFDLLLWLPMTTLPQRTITQYTGQSPLQSCRSFLSHTPLRWAIFKILEETLKNIFQISIRFKVIVLYVLDRFAPEETHIMAGISI